MAIAPRAIDPYIRSVVYARVAEIGLPLSDEFLRRHEWEHVIYGLLKEWIAIYDKTVVIGREYLASELFDSLLAENIIVEDGDELAGLYYKIRHQLVRNFAQKMLAGDPIYARRQRIGEKYFTDVFTGYGQEHASPKSVLSVVVPASDRIVSLSDNQPEIIEIRETAHGLAEALRNANDIGQFSEDELHVASAEIDLLVAALDGEAVRASYIAQVSPKILKWISEKAAGAAVGKAALSLLALIASFFGFGF